MKHYPGCQTISDLFVLMETQMPGWDPSDTKSRKMWPERFRLWGGRQSGDGWVALACEFLVPHPSIFLPRLMLITLIKFIFMLLLTRVLFRRPSWRSRRTSTFAEPPSSTRAGSSQLRTVLMISELPLMICFSCNDDDGEVGDHYVFLIRIHDVNSIPQHTLLTTQNSSLGWWQW